MTHKREKEQIRRTAYI